MCKLAEDLRKEGELRGEIKGRAEGRLDRLREGKLDLLVSIIKEGVFTLEDAAKKYGFTEQQIKQAMNRQ